MKNMGRIFVLAFLQVGIILVLPLFMGSETVKKTEEPPTQAVIVPVPEQERESEETVIDREMTIRLIVDGAERELSLEEYLFGVVAAEMPASFELEALKAQAVAARSYAMHCISSGVHDGAVCSDHSCCQAWLSDEVLREKWGDSYDACAEKMRTAVGGTDGCCLSYEGEAILAAFHSSSNGRTESSENVFGQAIPYLISVESNEDPETIPNYVSQTEFTDDELYAAVSAWNSEAAVRVSEGALFSEAVFSTTGRLLSVKLCGENVSGSQLRKIFSLRSADVSWQRIENGINFTSVGYGHGVGMSQYGADNMAKQGADWQEIVSHFYPGTDIIPVSAVAGGSEVL